MNFDIRIHDQDQRAHKLISQVNELERQLVAAGGNVVQTARLRRHIKALDRRAWALSSDDSNQCDNCGTAKGALNRVGLCTDCASTVEEQHG